MAVAVNCWVVPAAKLALVGETAMELTVLAVTVSEAVPLTPPIEAKIAVEPAPTAFARPDEFIEATAVFALVHPTVVVTLAVVPSLYVAIAVNCCVSPAAILAFAGEIVIEVTVLADTAREAVPLIPFREAVIAVDPWLIAFASPEGFIVATEAFPLVQATTLVTFAVEPSL